MFVMHPIAISAPNAVNVDTYLRNFVSCDNQDIWLSFLRAMREYSDPDLVIFCHSGEKGYSDLKEVPEESKLIVRMDFKAKYSNLFEDDSAAACLL